jgi:hypothetical protein
MKKKVAIVVLVMVLASLLAASTSFAAIYVVCNVNATGQAGTGPAVNLTDTAATPQWTGARWFSLDPAIANTCLAAALTAISSGYRVYCKIDSNVLGATVRYLYVMTDTFVP